MTAFDAGGLMVAYFGGNLAVRVITTPVLERFGFRRAVIVNGILSAAAIGLQPSRSLPIRPCR